MVTAANVKELRERTGCGMMDCKNALSETDGDMEKAIELLREKGLASAAKKAGRIASEGIVDVIVENGVGVIVEVNSETDFVAKNDDFRNFVRDVAKQIAATNPANVEELLEQKFINDNSVTIKDMLTEKIAKIGENMNIRRFERYDGISEGYIHGGGRIGVLVEFEANIDSKNTEFKEFAKDIAMQVAAANPQFVNVEDVDTTILDKEKEILRAQALNEGKPENIIDKMVQGRISKFYKEICIYEQAFIKDPDMTVKDLVKKYATNFGAEIKITRFARFEKGEGLEKKEDNFAEEVANMSK